MAINFNELPTTKPQATVPNGFYKATIVKAEMKVSKNTGAAYLSLQYDLSDDNGATGKLFDMQFDSDKEFLRYKLQRFINALKLDLQGSFELKDLCKLIVGRKLVVDVTTEDSDRGARNTVNSFDHEIYYPINEWAALINANAPVDVLDSIAEAEAETEATDIAADDALDANEQESY